MLALCVSLIAHLSNGLNLRQELEPGIVSEIPVVLFGIIWPWDLCLLGFSIMAVITQQERKINLVSR